MTVDHDSETTVVSIDKGILQFLRSSLGRLGASGGETTAEKLWFAANEEQL